jgi:hypothetical protein
MPWTCRTAGREQRVRALVIFRGRLGEQHPHTETVRRPLKAMDTGGEAAEPGADRRSGPSGGEPRSGPRPTLWKVTTEPA